MEDSRSNGFIERAVQTVQDQVRTMRSALEGRISRDLEADHPALAWLVSHASALLNRYHRDYTGRTAYRKLKGKGYDQVI